MPEFRTKPVFKMAVQWRGDNLPELREFVRPYRKQILIESKLPSGKPMISIATDEGLMVANIGDWIIRGVKGEYYPCKPDVFAESYEPVSRGEEDWIAEATREQLDKVRGCECHGVWPFNCPANRPPGVA